MWFMDFVPSIEKERNKELIFVRCPFYPGQYVDMHDPTLAHFEDRGWQELLFVLTIHQGRTDVGICLSVFRVTLLDLRPR